MARRREGWKLRCDPKTGIYQVRFRHGRRREISTGERDPTIAAQKAGLIYAEVISGRWDRELVVGRAGQKFDEVAANWLFDLKGLVKPKTWDLYEIHIAHLANFYKTIDRVTGTEDFVKARLKQVVRETCKKEITTLRRFMKWARKHQYIASVPELEYPPASAKGTPDKKRRHKTKTIPLDRTEALAILAELPATSKRARRGKVKHAVRDFYVVLWETGLRPTTVEQIASPTHFRKGVPELKVDEVIDKVQFKRDLDLTPAASQALDRWAPDEGLVFGAHDRRVPFRAACRAAAKKGLLAEWKKDLVTPYDFRHGRISDLLGRDGATLLGVAYAVGHKQVTTTNRYAHPERRQAAIALLGGVPPVAAPPPAGPAAPAAARPPRKAHSGGIRGESGKSGAPTGSAKVVH